MRIFRRLIIILMLSMIADNHAGAFAQETPAWQATLYEPSTGTIYVVDSSGLVNDTYTLPLTAGFDHYPIAVASGHGGSPLAYVAFNSITYQGVLIVSQRDRLLGRFSLPLSMATSFERAANEGAFSADNSRVALGYSLEGGGWEIVVLNTITGNVDYTLRSDLPAIAALGIANTPGLTPIVRQYNAETISFNLVLSGSAANSSIQAYDWNVNDNTVTANPIFISLDGDRFGKTNEMIMALADSRLENQKSSFSFPQSNSLHVYAQLSGARFPFFNVANATLQTPRFIQNGERILVDTATADGRYNWTVVERNGAVYGTLPTAISLNEIKGVTDGFIYTTDTFINGARTLVYVDTRNGLNAGVPIWTSNAGEQPLLVWAGDTRFSAQAAATVYTAWAQLAEPVYAPGSVPLVEQDSNQSFLVSPSQIVTPEATRRLSNVLLPGGIAVIHTTEGDQLNVREGAGTNYLIVAKLGDGARVTIIEGPVAADGFTWWHVRTNSGIAGWVVESVKDDGKQLQTLLPA